MRQLENVGETLVSSYFSKKEVLIEKFGTDLSSENPFWEESRHHPVSSLSDICIKVSHSTLNLSPDRETNLSLCT